MKLALRSAINATLAYFRHCVRFNNEELFCHRGEKELTFHSWTNRTVLLHGTINGLFSSSMHHHNELTNGIVLSRLQESAAADKSRVKNNFPGGIVTCPFFLHE